VTVLRLTVPGLVGSKGSNRAMVRNGKALFVPGSDNAARARAETWTACAIAALRQAVEGRAEWPKRTGRVAIAAVFGFPLRLGDFDDHGNLRRSTPWQAVGGVDFDKATRLLADAVTAARCVWRDDNQACGMADKVYLPPGVGIHSVVLLGGDVREVTAAWLAELQRAEAAIETAKLASASGRAA
jgi:hypothetical protein